MNNALFNYTIYMKLNSKLQIACRTKTRTRLAYVGTNNTLNEI